MAKYYAVKKGRRPGIYRSWDECRDQVDGFSGAVYKSFNNEEKAKRFISQGHNSTKDSISAYVDGSYDSDTGVYGWGLVLIRPGSIEEFCGHGKGEYSKHRNVAGEVYGAINAVKISLEREYKSLSIYYDYSGIRHWALGEWKRNNSLTRSYYDFMQDASNHIDIEFIKVDAHSGDKYNELADKLAKEGAKGGSR